MKDVGVPEGDYCALSREELEAEVRRLRAKVRATRMDKARQNAVFDSALEFAMVVTDCDGIITAWNSGAEHVMGWTADEMQGQDASRFFTPEDNADERVAFEMETALRNDRASDERWHLKKGEQRFWASGEMMVLRDEDEAHIGFVKIMRDRTAEHLAGVALKETQERYRLASKATNDAVWDWDLNTNHVQWNEALADAYGHPAASVEPTGDWWFAHIHPDDRVRIDASMHAVIDSTGTAWTDEYRFQRDDGSYAEVLDRGHVIRDAGGKACRMIGAMLDLTRLHTAEAALRVSEERFRTILETIEAAFAIVEVKFDADDRPVDYRFIEANPAFERQAGVNLRGKWVTEFAPNLERFWFETYGHVAKTGEPATFENYAEAFGRWFDVRAVRVGAPAERRIAIFFSDVTERRTLAAERDRALAELRESEQRRAALLKLGDQFAAIEGGDTASLAAVACSVLGHTLKVQLVGYGLVDAEAETITVERDWTSGDAQTIAGTLRFRDFGSYIDDLKRAETVVVPDARVDRRTQAQAQALEAISARAFINAPVFEQGRFVSLLFVCSVEPRNWTDDELAFVREVATRTRAATARRQAESDLRASEAELRLVADNVPFLVSFVDASLTYRFANAAYRDWFGRAPEDVIGLTIPELAGAESFAARRPALERALAGEQQQIYVNWPWPDGRRRIADIRYVPRQDASGMVDGIYAFAQDVTALRDAAAVLSERADTLAREVAERTADRNALWQLSSVLMLRSSFEGLITAVNPAWTELLGWHEDELLGSSLFDLIHPDDMAHTIAGARELFNGDSHTRFDNRYRHKDGSYRWITWSTRSAEGMINAVGRDFTAEKEQALALETAAEALRQSQKMEAVGQLTGGVAHDFNNLLTIIRSSVDFLRRPDLPEERRKRYMDAVSDTVDRAAKLTGQLLAFARRQALKPEVLNVGERLRAVADMLDTVTGARVKVVVELQDQPCFIRADQSQFETALVNMAVNARDAMDGEGTLTLRLTCGGAMPPIRGHGGGVGAFARIDLTDTGSGIAEADLARIFEPFFTTKEVGKGTGLGLSQVFGFAKQSGGDVDVTSEVGRGTTFTLYLPEVEPEASRDERDEETGPAPGGAGRRVLVVEDNIDVGKFATQILDDLGYRTEWVANAETALERLGSDGDGFDVVFSDVVMPGMGGIALAEQLRRHLPRLPVVLASGYSHVLAQDGAHGFELLQKPYSADQLSRVLRRVTRKKRIGKVR